jgi:CRISPR-associated protein Cas2
VTDLVISYDINTQTPEGANRLVHVAAICERYGQRAQYSVFECRLSDVQLARLVAELNDVIDDEVDSVCIYHLAGGIDRASHRLGRQSPHELGTSWML